MSDRTIHAITAYGTRVVRYDRAGKWYAEREQERNRIAIGEAVDLAASRGSIVFLGKPGGKAFDARLKAAILERVS